MAHPDDEVLWMGGTILMHPAMEWSVYSLCRQSDPDRAPRFHRTLGVLQATGGMGDLNDGPEQHPLPDAIIRDAVLSLLPDRHFDLIYTHSPTGEYTRHMRHEEVSRAVLNLWKESLIQADRIWLFAYEDGDRTYLPRAIPDAPQQIALPEDIWRQKYEIITSVYGFGPESFEAQTTPRQEAFWVLSSPDEVDPWLTHEAKP